MTHNENTMIDLAFEEEFDRAFQIQVEKGEAELSHYRRYHVLSAILQEAYDFAAHGKGNIRHGKDGLPWHEQRHYQIARKVGLGFPLGQAVKKIEEGNDMDDWDRTRLELLGAIGYIASAIYAGDQGVD